MKKIVIVGLLSLSAAGAYAQGTVVFYNNVAATIVTHIYSPQLATPTVELTGNGAGDYGNGVAGGSAVYTGTPIGGATGTEPAGALSSPYNISLINYTYGNNFTAQLYANGAGTGQPIGSLLPVAQYVTTMATSAGQGAGFIVQPNIANDPGIPNANAFTDAGNGILDNRATCAIACWYNAGGTITSLANAITAGVPYGESAAFNVTGLGEPSSIMTAYNGTTSSATQPAYLTRLTSFSLVTPVPEPATIALGVMGACAFLARRKK